MHYKNYNIKHFVKDNVLFLFVNGTTYIFRGMDYRVDYYKDLMFLQNFGTLTIYDTSVSTIEDIAQNGYTGSYGYYVVQTITFYNIVNNQPMTIIKQRLTHNKQIHDSLMLQQEQNIYNLKTNIMSNNNIPKVLSWQEYSYDTKNNDIVDNFVRDFQLE